MFFQKKTKKDEAVCHACRSEVSEKYSYCPYCGQHLVDSEHEMKKFGMIGRSDIPDEELLQQELAAQMGFADRIFSSLMKTLMRNLNAQMSIETTEMRTTPNGVRIRMGSPQKQKREQHIVNRPLSNEQLERISSLPRTEAKTNVRRFSDRIVYELAAPGVQSIDDVLFSKTESGYEIKALTKNKVYTSNLPLNLPLRGFALHDKGVIVEFALHWFPSYVFIFSLCI